MMRFLLSVPALLLGLLIRVYQLAVSPLFAGSCRYQPSCSEYARQAIARFGAVRGSYLMAARLLRCHPWGGAGYDPVPGAFPGQPPRHPTTKRCRHG